MQGMIRAPFDLSLDEYIKGIGREADDLDIIEDFEGTYLELLSRMDYGPTSPFFNKPVSPIRYTSMELAGIAYAKTESGAIGLNLANEIVAFYCMGTISVLESIRHRGIGRELTIITSLLHKRNPAWPTTPESSLMYTKFGLATHQRAWEYYRRFPRLFEINE